MACNRLAVLPGLRDDAAGLIQTLTMRLLWVMSFGSDVVAVDWRSLTTKNRLPTAP
jgi:hypothetical protein